MEQILNMIADAIAFDLDRKVLVSKSNGILLSYSEGNNIINIRIVEENDMYLRITISCLDVVENKKRIMGMSVMSIYSHKIISKSLTIVNKILNK